MRWEHSGDVFEKACSCDLKAKCLKTLLADIMVGSIACLPLLLIFYCVHSFLVADLVKT